MHHPEQACIIHPLPSPPLPSLSARHASLPPSLPHSLTLQRQDPLVAAQGQQGEVRGGVLGGGDGGGLHQLGPHLLAGPEWLSGLGGG